MSAPLARSSTPLVRLQRPHLVSLAGLLLLVACGTGSGAAVELVDQAPSQIGRANNKPGTAGVYDGATYLVDTHSGGYADAVFVEELFWGRLVDVYDEDPADGESRLVYPDMVVGDSVLTQFGTWRLEQDALAGTTRLVIERENTPAPDDAFDALVDQALAAVDPVLTKGLDPSESPPFSFVARNAALVVRFSDLVDPSTVALNDSVRVRVGNPPTQAFDARLLFDQNHGGIATTIDEFRSTRLIVDMTVGPQEQLQMSDPLPLNGLGLPASLEPLMPNVALAFPSQIDEGGAQFELVRNLKGEPLAQEGNGPVDITSASLEVVRAMRSGNAGDPSNGFLEDTLRPSLVGRQAISISSVVPDQTGQPGEDFVIGFTYQAAACAFPPAAGDVIRLDTGAGLDVVQAANVTQGVVSGLRVRVQPADAPIVDASVLTGSAAYRTVWREELELAGLAPCFVRFVPEAVLPPAHGVHPEAQLVLEFSEPIDPASLLPFDTLTIGRNEAIGQATDYVVGNLLVGAGLTEVRAVPSVGFGHVEGGEESYFLTMSSDPQALVGISDLAGNRLTRVLPQIEFTLDGAAPPNMAGGWALTFSAENEDGVGGPDLVGQFVYDLDRGEIAPRGVQRYTAVADRTQPLVGQMTQIPLGVQTPLSNLGSKLHTMWRYADVGLPITKTDGTFVNVDVESISFSPSGGGVNQTFYPQFEMRLGHAARIPDELLDAAGVPVYPFSGLRGNATFDENYLTDPDNEPAVVHPRELGFLVAQTGVFQSSTGTPMLRLPMNVGVPPDEKRYYTWRDTAIEGRGALNPQGTATTTTQLPFNQEAAVVLGFPTPPGLPASQVVWPGGTFGLPSVGLPLLMEFRCYPSEAISLNTFDVSIAAGGFAQPFFRAFSTGGFNTSQAPVTKDPDSEPVPSGGFNGVAPTAPGQPALGAATPARDPTVYIGQLDIVVRVSRVYTTLIDSERSTPDYVASVQEPAPGLQPSGTEVHLAFRGNGDTGSISESYFNVPGSPGLDLYGNDVQNNGSQEIALTVPGWSDDLDGIDGQRYAQLRISLVANAETLLVPWLSAVALAYR